MVEQKSEKLRLNITVDKNVVEKAKVMGFNISGAFEEFLKVFTYRPKPEYEDIVRAYNDFLQRVQYVLSLYEIEVEIGKYPDVSYLKKGKIAGYDPEDEQTKKALFHSDCKIFLDLNVASILKDGKYFAITNYMEENYFLLDFNDMQFLYPPQKILENLVSEIKKVATNNEKEIQKLNLARKIINAIFSENGGNSSESGSETPLLRRIREDVEAEEMMIVGTNYAPNSREEKKEIIAAV